jgi:hypothetical protein
MCRHVYKIDNKKMYLKATKAPWTLYDGITFEKEKTI